MLPAAALKSGLEAQISNLSTSQSSSSTELDQLKHRVEDAEREKRDLMGVVNRLKEDATQRDGALFAIISCINSLYFVDEVQNLRNSLRQARQEHQTQETQVRELRSSETSNKACILYLRPSTLSSYAPLVQDRLPDTASPTCTVRS
jgi:nucleoprotein TPR